MFSSNENENNQSHLLKLNKNQKTPLKIHLASSDNDGLPPSLLSWLLTPLLSLSPLSHGDDGGDNNNNKS